MGQLACTIVVSGELDQRFGAAFEGLALTAGDGMTELSGSLADQAQLQGVLRQLFDLGLSSWRSRLTPRSRHSATPDHPLGGSHPGEPSLRTTRPVGASRSTALPRLSRLRRPERGATPTHRG